MLARSSSFLWQFLSGFWLYCYLANLYITHKFIYAQKRTRFYNCYNLNVMRQSACLVINPITVDGYAARFNCTPVDRASDSMMARPKAIHFSWLGPELSSVAWSTGAQLIIFFCFRFSVVLFDRPGISIRHAAHCIC